MMMMIAAATTTTTQDDSVLTPVRMDLSMAVEQTQLSLTQPPKQHTQQMSQPSQRHHRTAPEVYRIERTAYQVVATENGPYNTCQQYFLATGIIPNKLHRSLKLLNLHPALSLSLSLYIYIYIYRVTQKECARLREAVPYVKVYRYNPKHLCTKLNGYGNNGLRSLKL